MSAFLSESDNLTPNSWPRLMTRSGHLLSSSSGSTMSANAALACSFVALPPSLCSRSSNRDQQRAHALELARAGRGVAILGQQIEVGQQANRRALGNRAQTDALVGEERREERVAAAPSVRCRKSGRYPAGTVTYAGPPS